MHFIITDPTLLPAPPVTDLASVKSRRLADLASLRYQAETAGITVGGQPVATDRASQSMLIGAWCRMQQAPDTVIDWKGETGWVQLNRAAVEAIAAAVGHHVEACFSRERELAEQIAACQSVAEVEAVDIAAGWP